MVINMDVKEGQVSSEPQLFTTRTGRPKLAFRLAVARDASRAPKRGEEGGEGRGADLIHVVMYGPKAAALHPLLRTGAQVLVVGWTQSRNYRGRDGESHSATETVAERITFAAGPGNPAPTAEARPQTG